jgi:D-alanyl-D-alanine carboxypeptidase
MPNLIAALGILFASVLTLVIYRADVDGFAQRSTEQNTQAIASIHNVSLQPVIQGQVASPMIEKRFAFTPKSEDQSKEIPEMSAFAYQAVDVETRQILASQNIFEQRQLASVTKLMTAMVVLDEYEWGAGEFFPMSESAFAAYGGNSIRVGELFSIEDYLRALLIASSNDSANLLAERFGEGNLDRFVWKMNQKARRLNLTQTVFANPSGLDEPEESHFSTTHDVTEMGIYAYKNYPEIWEVLALESAILTSQDGRQVEVRNTNRILSDDYMIAGKTGMTEEAGETFFVILNVNGRDVALTLMGSDFGGGRFADTSRAYEWISANFTVE